MLHADYTYHSIAAYKASANSCLDLRLNMKNEATTFIMSTTLLQQHSAAPAVVVLAVSALLQKIKSISFNL
jgi:hypothetical protein